MKSLKAKIETLLKKEMAPSDIAEKLQCKVHYVYNTDWKMKNAKKKSLKEAIENWLNDCQTPQYIASKLNCNIQYVYNVRNKLKQEQANKQKDVLKVAKIIRKRTCNQKLKPIVVPAVIERKVYKVVCEFKHAHSGTFTALDAFVQELNKIQKFHFEVLNILDGTIEIRKSL
jgi:DNA invertase Pin-like site-specific DNA recombinase